MLIFTQVSFFLTRLSHWVVSNNDLPIDLLTAVWYNYPISLVDPETHLDYFNIQLTGIDSEKVKGAPSFAELWKKIEPIMSRLHYAVTPNLR